MPPRRTPSQQAADLRAKAAALERKAQIASDPILKAAIKLRAMMPDTRRTGELTGAEVALVELIDALDNFIMEDPNAL